MPLYEYKCRACGKQFELLRRMQDADFDLECPDCRSPKVERQISTFSTAVCSASPSGRFT